jgi:hypothetical protein
MNATDDTCGSLASTRGEIEKEDQQEAALLVLWGARQVTWFRVVRRVSSLAYDGQR